MTYSPPTEGSGEGLVDIEKALLKIDEVASNQEGIAAEEALILRGYVMLRNSIMLISMNAG